MRVEDWMRRRPVTISPQETLRTAWRIIREHRIRHLPVVEQGRLVGMVTDRDLRHALPSRAASLEMHEIPYLAEKVRIWEVMARAVVTIHREAPVEEAILRQKPPAAECRRGQATGAQSMTPIKRVAVPRAASST